MTLPLKWIVLNGSASSDDLAIESWLWTREADSLAAGTIVANSDRTNSLMVGSKRRQSTSSFSVHFVSDRVFFFVFFLVSS